MAGVKRDCYAAQSEKSAVWLFWLCERFGYFLLNCGNLSRRFYSGEKMSDMPNEFSPKGALLGCFMDFPQFDEDMDVLVREGYLVVTSPETCEWTKSKTSLAEYFKWSIYSATSNIKSGSSPLKRIFKASADEIWCFSQVDR